MKPRYFFSAVLLGSTLLWSGCVYRERAVYRQPAAVEDSPQGEIVVSDDPPPPIVETVPVAPGPAFVWIGGFWAWNGHWVWEHGRWGRPPHRGAVWVGPHYVVRGGRHYYAHGHWR